MKKIIVPIILVIVFIMFAIIFLVPKNDKKEISNNAEIINNDKVQNNEISNNTIIEIRILCILSFFSFNILLYITQNNIKIINSVINIPGFVISKAIISFFISLLNLL